MRFAIPCFLLTTVVAFVPGNSAADNSASLSEALASGKPILNLRPRYENVDQIGKDTGEAFTVRTLAGWKTGNWNGLSATAELIDVGRASDDYNDSRNGKTQYPVIADPDNTDINQLYLDYTGISGTRVRGGRQSIKLDNVRFVGNVEFRQVMQVFNGIVVENKSFPDTRIFAGHLARVKTVNDRQFDTATTLLNVNHALTADDAIVGYGYFQDQQNAIASTAFQGPAPSDTSNAILGLRANGAHPMNPQWKLLYTLEHALQRDYADGDARIDADYTRIGGGVQWGNYALRLDYEVLASNDGRYAFQTPLGTNHLFQGWADQFLTIPRQGIRDTFISGRARIAKAQMLAEYHQFDSEFGSVDFGKELDLGVSYPLMEKLIGKIEYADYQAGDVSSGKVDVSKLWLTLIYNY